LAFKPNIDDLRESPALLVTKTLINDDFQVLAVEPNIKEYNEFDIILVNDAIEKADIVVFLVKHNEFINIDIKDKIVLDFVNSLD
jgi:UDP-N-acetyl-D-mannosaminuronic acid dehydrogenase